MEMIIGMEKSGKMLKSCNADLENADVYYTVDYSCINFLAFHDTKHLKFKVQKFESHSMFSIEEYIVLEILAFKSQSCNVFVYKKMNKMP